MPLYEYECEKCGERFEVMQSVRARPLKTHDVCGGKVERLLSAPAFQFKGSGWYITDYAGDKKKGGKEAKEPSEASSESKSETKKKGSDSGTGDSGGGKAAKSESKGSGASSSKES